jgi:hypothetical protein
MSKLDDLIAQAKDDETKKLLRQVAAVVEADTRKVMEAAHAAALQERARRHADALSAKDREHTAVVEAKDAVILNLEETVADLESKVSSRDQTIARRNVQVANLTESASDAKGWALVTTFTTALLSVNAATKRRGY